MSDTIETNSIKSQDIQIVEVRNQKDLTTFIRFPWEIYRGDRHWVPPLIKDQLHKLSPDHPFRSHSEMILFLAMKDGKLIGRISGIIDHNYIKVHQEKTGFFGFFESISDYKVAEALFEKVRSWLKGKGMEKMIGPMNPNSNDECGLLIEGFDSPPCLMMTYNLPYYSSLLENAGMKKAMDLYAYLLESSSFLEDRLSRISERLMKKNPRLRIRTVDLRHFDEEVKIVKEISNEAWSPNWGFVPRTEEELDDIARNLKPLVVPDLVLFVYWGEEPIGFSVTLPDYNQVLKHLNGKLGPLGLLKFLYYSRRIKTVRVMLLGVKQAFQKRGAESLLYLETFQHGIKKGYLQAECSMILETNFLMRHGIEAMGGKIYKTYRIYEIPI
jgi:hypothetical protein